MLGKDIVVEDIEFLSEYYKEKHIFPDLFLESLIFVVETLI